MLVESLLDVRYGLGLTIEDLAILELADVAHSDGVAGLGSSTLAKLLVVDLDTLDLLDTQGAGGLLSRLLSRLLGGGSGALLQVLGELNLLALLGILLLLNGGSLAVVLLELLLLLLAESRLVGSRLGLLGGTLVLALGLDQLGGLLVALNLGDSGVLQLIEVVALVLLAQQSLEIQLLLTRGEVVVVLIVVILVVGTTGAVLISGNDVVTGQVDGVGTGDLEENTLLLTNGDVERLLAVLHGEESMDC